MIWVLMEKDGLNGWKSFYNELLGCKGVGFVVWGKVDMVFCRFCRIFNDFLVVCYVFDSFLRESLMIFMFWLDILWSNGYFRYVC